jgi:hypothetical protein
MRAAHNFIDQYCAGGGRPSRRAAHYSIDQYCAGGGRRPSM